ncbi:MAG: hypothetical protein U0934_14070 [Pseudotabrizicola sp.]|uniref:hypothetical protein n=1 Tax=Pseudotabrizicola sp. TaxID=2939647 RepID=UPI00272FE29E|nr:hypothetical protein [Pseudotabrizicola sp.]MDP2081635.1 hypothetical protein [Pseudotabrizicola sp.]MDZ7575060.1 hypothetical protein [Pseudotabrizicola sp.]
MSDTGKVFTYQTNGLSYTVTVYEKDGSFFADIKVTEGSMDVNAIYFGDDDFSGASASLSGPLNMNGGGAQYEGETVQWDQAMKLSDPGLGHAGTDKDTFLAEGDVYTVSLDISSLDEIDFFGVRATSTSTPEGSIKGVAGDPETTDDPEEPLHDKVFFDNGTDENGMSLGGVFILSEEPEDNVFDVSSLPEGTEPTFANYVSYFEELGGDIGSVASVAFYETDEDGNPVETFRIDAPDGGWADGDAVIESYNAAIESMADEDAGEDLIASLSTGTLAEDAPYVEDDYELEEALVH